MPAGAPRRFSRKQIEYGLRKAYGIYTFAALAIEQATGRKISRQGVKLYCDRDPGLAALRRELLDTIIDKAELNIVTAVFDGDKESSKFVLKTQGRDRGWLENPTARELAVIDARELDAITGEPPVAPVEINPAPGPVIEGEVEELERLDADELLRRYRAEIGTDA